MKTSSTASCLSIGLCLLALAGCASGPTTTADLMKQHATEGGARVDLQNRLAKDWETGKKMVAAGSKRVEDGEARVSSARREAERGQADIERGRREVAEGRNLVAESERRFRENFPDRAINPGP